MTYRLYPIGMVLGHTSDLTAENQFFYLSLGHHINHDLGGQTKRVYKRFTIGQHVYLPLCGHVVLEQFLLLFGERVGQGVSGSNKLIQSLVSKIAQSFFVTF